MGAVAGSVALEPVRLRELLAAVFAAHGCATIEADIVARHLVEADLSGHPSHGSSLVPIYISNLLKGEVRANAAIERVPLQGGFLLFAGGNGFGQSIGAQLVEQVVASSLESGIAVFGLRHVHHLGRIGDYAEMFAAAGFASVLFVNTVSRPIVSPHGGAEARMGTNPVCIAVPRGNAGPLLLDFATSAIAVGKCRVALEMGDSIPPGAAIDASGEPTTDPRALYATPQGALLAMAGHKGSGLNLVCELFSACIGGLTMDHARPASGSVVNNLLGMCFRLQALPGAYEQIEATIRYFLATRPNRVDGPVKLPGAPEEDARLRRGREGVPMAATTWAKITELARAAGVADSLVGAVVMSVGPP